MKIILFRVLAYSLAIAVGLVIGITAAGYFLDPLLLINGRPSTLMTEQQIQALLLAPGGGARIEQFTVFRPTGTRIEGGWLQFVVLITPAALLVVVTRWFRKRRIRSASASASSAVR